MSSVAGARRPVTDWRRLNACPPAECEKVLGFVAAPSPRCCIAGASTLAAPVGALQGGPRRARQPTQACQGRLMRLYPKVIPVISRETIQQLMKDGDIEVEPMRIADAEMDLSAIMREYLTNEERVNQATREALERRGYDHSKFNQVKREMADVRGFKMGDEGIEYVVNQIIEFLLISHNVEEAFAAHNALRRESFT